MTRPMVSVIIPAYRAETTIAHALRSVFAQTLPPDEVIVVDDGSPDSTAALVARDFPSVLLLRQANAGAAAARNAGAAEARGEWLAFLDADDTWLPGKLERQVREVADPQVGVIGGQVVGRSDDHFDPAPGFDALWERNIIPTSSVLVRRSAYRAAGGMSAALALCEDYHLWLRLRGEGWRVVICGEPLVRYTPATDSLTRQRARFAEAERACIEDIGARFSLPKRRMRERLAEAYQRHAWGALHLRDMRSARSFMWCSLRYRITARQLAGLVIASAPGRLLDLRRSLCGGDGSVPSSLMGQRMTNVDAMPGSLAAGSQGDELSGQSRSLPTPASPTRSG